MKLKKTVVCSVLAVILLGLAGCSKDAGHESQATRTHNNDDTTTALLITQQQEQEQQQENEANETATDDMP